MRVAIFHNFMDNIGGAEKVSLILARELGADIYTTVASRNAIKKLGFSTPVTELGWIPRNPPFRQQLAAWRFWKLNLAEQYDAFIIAGDWALPGAVHNKPNLFYCHSPSRELWDLYADTRQHLVPFGGRLLFDGWVGFNRLLNRRFLPHVTTLVASSQNAQGRLKHYLNREAELIYPPVDTASHTYRENGTFWLSVNRLIPYKRVALQLAAFAQMPDQRLVIVGSYEPARHFQHHAAWLKQQAPSNVRFVHWANDRELKDLYSRCRGFIATSHGEDFGMSAIEAMAAGKPVIAVDEGGFRETVINGITGKLITADVEQLIAAVREVGHNPHRWRAACHEQAQRFDTAICIEKMKRLLYDPNFLDSRP